MLNEWGFLMAGGLFGLLFLLVIAAIFLAGIVFYAYGIAYQRKHIPRYSAGEIYTMLRTIQRNRSLQWQTTLFGTIMGDLLFLSFLLVFRGFIFALTFVLTFFNLLLILRIIQQYERIRILSKRFNELELKDAIE